MRKMITPLAGVFIFMILALEVSALNIPTEVIIKIKQPVTLQTEAAGTRTNLPDVDALLSRFPGITARYAVDSYAQKHESLKKYLILHFDSDQLSLASSFVDQARKLASIGWAGFNQRFQCNSIPNDLYYPQQWGLQRIHAAQAWDRTLGGSTIPIAIIDTGCEMDHPDLVNSFWTNQGEIPDNGIDDDGNGFTDDIHGWDFVDAPSFPTGGDYLVRDNDPSDEMGHGTAVAGICGAVINNEIGIAGTAPDCPLMILRAGNMNGYLQEDDVASAILYALDNGARIVNMSFGDTEASPMLEEIIDFAAQGGLLMIAAAGNSGNQDLIYPAAYSPVLSVGACDQNGSRANFSNYGVSLDLLAPGVEIISTTLGQNYGAFQGGNGTSYAAPFASGSAGLVLALHPDWQPVDVKSVLKSTAEDVGSPGWDPQTGQGIIRPDQAVLINAALSAEITGPVMEQGFASAESLLVIGTAAGVYLNGYQLYTGIGNNPTEWDLIRELQGQQVVNDILAIWHADSLADSIYTLRLVVEDIFGNEMEDRVKITFDQTAPSITNISLVPIMDANRPSFLLTFSTDDLTTGKVRLQNSNNPTSRWLSQELNYESKNHTLLLGHDLPIQQFIYYIWVTNSAGLVDSTDILGSINLNVPPIVNNDFVELPGSQIPPLYLYDDATDLNGDGWLELWGDTLFAGGSKADLRGYQASANWVFDDLGLDFGRQIPKSIGDSDADGKKELLTLYGGASKIFEADSINRFPNPQNIVWSDSGDVWGAKLLDLNPSDDHGEILLVTGGIYQLWSRWDDGTTELVQSLPNPFNPTPSTIPPYCRMGDWDGDNKVELLFGDYQGDLYIYEQQTTGFEVTWQTTLPLLDTGEFLTDGDYDNDNQKEFAALAHSQTTLSGEHLVDTRYWGLYIFKNTGVDNEYSAVDTLYFFGVEDPSDFPSGISSGNVSQDASDEILLCLYPDFYVVNQNASTGQYSVLWYYPQCNCNKAVVGDFNRNGHNEIMFSDGQSMKTFEEVGTWSYWPPPPLNFRASPKPDRVNLSWAIVPTADTYNLYKGPTPNTLQILTELQPQETAYTDFAVVLDSTYYYAIQTVDLGAQYPEGPRTVPIAAIPNNPPYVVGDTAHFVPPNFVIIQFNEPMGSSILDPNNYWIPPQLVQPNSVVSDGGDTRAILTYNSIFTDSTYRLIIHELYDLQGSVLSTLDDTLGFDVPQQEQALPYLISASSDANYRTITLVFSQPMKIQDLGVTGNYSITVDPIMGFSENDPVTLAGVSVNSETPDRVDLMINKSTPLGALGKIFRVKARNLYSAGGAPIDTTKNSLALAFIGSNLNRTFVYPNPYKGGTLVDGEECVVFANLTPNAEIRIVNVSGIAIKTLRSTNNLTGGIRWYLDNDMGQKVGSGIYLYYVSGDGDTAWGKLAIVR
ncbi:MAG: S8 family serine peptidase [bacterium]|nr:S8 family serine peptidase [bacterium]